MLRYFLSVHGPRGAFKASVMTESDPDIKLSADRDKVVIDLNGTEPPYNGGAFSMTIDDWITLVRRSTELSPSIHNAIRIIGKS